MKLLLLAVQLAIVFAKEYDVDVYYNLTGCKLPPIENGKYSEFPTSGNGTNVHVICDIGYRFEGDSHITCDESTRNLTAKLPVCIGCALPPLENGNYLDVSLWFDNPAVYSYCHTGFRHLGSIDHVCNISTGEFTKNNYTCEDINECVTLPVKEGDDIRGPCDVNAVCTNLEGSHNCTCNENYTGNGTYCRHVDNCPVLTDPKNGRVKMTDQVAYFTCNKGYQRLGSHRVRCWKRSWIHRRLWPTVCLKKRGYCSTPPALDNGYLIGTDYNVGNIIRYGCLKGYILTGPDVKTCTANGWTSGNTFCDQKATTSVAEMTDVLKQKLETLSSGSSTARLFRGQKYGADIVFMIDRSSSILPSSLERIRKFVMMVVNEFGVDNPNPRDYGSRVSVVTFGSKVDIIFKLSDQSIASKDIVKQRLDEIKPHGGNTALRPALERVMLEVATETRSKSQKALFIIADGQSNINGTTDPKFIVRDLKRKGFELFVVGVGSLRNIEELHQYASQPYRKHFFILQNFVELQRLTDRVVLDKSSVICGKGGNIKEPKEIKSKAKKGDWPFLGLIWDETGSVSDPICGGALICKNWFLTSASCVQSKITVELSVHDYLDEGNQLRLPVLKKHIHPHFNDLKYDLALIEFNDADTEGIFRSSIQPVCLRGDPGLSSDYANDTELWIAGWGANLPNLVNHKQNEINDVPLYTKLPVVNSVECKGSFPGLVIPDSTFCAGHRIYQDEACRGDIGGPILKLSDKGFQVVGLAKRTEHCAEKDQYGLFTEVLSEEALGWIHNVTKDCNLALHKISYF